MSEGIRFYTLRLTLDGFVDYPGLEKVLKDKSKRWFWGKHEGESGDVKPHVHWYIESTIKEQALRSIVARHKKSKSDRNKVYSLSELRETIVQYGSYVMMKPETVASDMDGITEEEIDEMTNYASKFEEVHISEKKDSKSYISRLISEVPYDLSRDDRYNFYAMHDWLVDQRLLNLYTESKMTQLYSLWCMHVLKTENQKEYKRRRELYYERVQQQFELQPWRYSGISQK